MIRRLIGFVGAVGLGLGMAVGQGVPAALMPADAHPSFDVSTIKLSDPASHRQGINSNANHVGAQGQTLKSLMMFAYGVHGQQIVGAPGWVSEDKYEIDGRADVEGEPNLKQMQEMFRKLLVDRFGLQFHPAKHEMTYYAIRVAKGGAKLGPVSTNPDPPPDQSGNGDAKGMTMKFTDNSMSDFRLGMQYFLDKPVVNETGLDGRFTFTLRWTPDDFKGTTDGDGPPGMFTAIQEQLGLKLEVSKGPVDVMVLDRVTRPSAN
jgi:uncharacterized protein (TIGR03435 family)